MPENIGLSDERIMQIYVNKMVTDKSGQDLDEEDVDKITRVLISQLNERLEHAVISALPDEALAELNDLLDENGTTEEIDRVFDESGMDFDAVVKQTLEDFRQDYLQNGDNAALIKKADEQTAEFLATAPEGQGHEAELDDIYKANAAEDKDIDMKYGSIATAGENL